MHQLFGVKNKDKPAKNAVWYELYLYHTMPDAM